MSNPTKDHPSVRVHAPPGGHSNNIFGNEFEQSAANKKKHMESDIFGSKADHVEQASVAKQTRSTGNNIFGAEPESANTSAGTLAGQYKQTQMKSNIFGTDEPTSARAPSDKNKSNIFGIGDTNEQNKHHGGVRRVGYNPINGESYTPKENLITNDNKAADATGKTSEDAKHNVEHTEAAATENIPTPSDAKKVEDASNGQKNVHTSVRVFHPPGGKSNGPLW